MNEQSDQTTDCSMQDMQLRESLPLLLAEQTKRMFRVAFRLSADEEQARDAVQEACVKALAKADTFDGRSSLATWLHRITVNCVHDVLRKEGRQGVARQSLAQNGTQTQTFETPHSRSPAAAAELSEMAALAWTFVDQLPQDSRSAFALTQLDGYSYDEAAQILNLPRGTVATHVFRAKKILLEQMNSRTQGRRHE